MLLFFRINIIKYDQSEFIGVKAASDNRQAKNPKLIILVRIWAHIKKSNIIVLFPAVWGGHNTIRAFTA